MTDPAPGSGLFETLLGARYAALAPAVQRFHRLQRPARLEGWVETAAPASGLARLAAFALGSPRAASKRRFAFELVPGVGHEIWRRHFADRPMASRLCAQGGQLQERLGPATLRFDLRVEDGALVFQLASLRLWGVPCPRAWLPRVSARESGDGDFLHFHITAEMRGAGVVANYQGRLFVPAGER